VSECHLIQLRFHGNWSGLEPRLCCGDSRSCKWYITTDFLPLASYNIATGELMLYGETALCGILQVLNVNSGWYI
jgi:hypothetical protein